MVSVGKPVVQFDRYGHHEPVFLRNQPACGDSRDRLPPGHLSCMLEVGEVYPGNGRIIDQVIPRLPFSETQPGSVFHAGYLL